MINTKKMLQLRKQAKLTQGEAAQLVGIGRTAYGKYENGVAQPSIDMIGRIADCFGVTVDFLLDRVDFPNNILPTKKQILQEMKPEEILQEIGITDNGYVVAITDLIKIAKEKSYDG